MNEQTRAQLKALKTAKVLSGGNQTTAKNLRDMFDGIIDSMSNILDDANNAGGFMALDGNGIADVTKIKKVTPTGEFLKDDGTWGPPPSFSLSAQNGLTLSTSVLELGGPLTTNTSIPGAGKDFSLGVSGSLINDLSILSNSSTTISTTGGAQQSYMYQDSSYLVIGVDNSFSNTFEIYNAGAAIANNGTNNSLVVTDAITNKGLVYAGNYSSNFTFESLVSKRYVDTTLSTGYVPYTGAAADLAMGAHSITAQNIIINADPGGLFTPLVINGGSGNNAYVNLSGPNISAVNFINTGTSVTWRVQNQTVAGATLDDFGVGITTNPNDNFTQWKKTGTQRHIANVQTSGATATYAWVKPNNTNQTASTEINGWLFTSGTRQWATGAITANAEFNIIEPTYSAVGTSTMTTAATFSINNAPQQGTNLTITNPYAIWVRNGNSLFEGSIHLTGNRFIGSLNSSFSLRSNNLPRMAFTLNGAATFTSTAETSGAITAFTVTSPAHTGQTASTNIPSFTFNTGSRQWANGAVTLQEEFIITAPVYSHVSGSNTITTAGTLNVYSPTVTGGFTTITNPYAIISNGSILIKPSTLSWGIDINGQVGFNNLIRIRNSGGNVGLSMDSGLKAVFYAGGGINYPTVTGSADQNVGIGFNTNQTSMIANGVARLIVTGTTAASALNDFQFTPANKTNSNASTEIPGLLYNSSSRQWATGNFTTQREWYIKTATYTAIGLSTITNAYGLYVERATASTNLSITNNFGFGTDGGIVALSYMPIGYTNTIIQTQGFGNGLFGSQFLANGGTCIASNSTGTAIGFKLGGTSGGTEVWRMSATTGNLTNTGSNIAAGLSLKAGTTAQAQINLVNGVAPTAPNNGDIWFDGTDIKMQIGGVTKTFTLV